MMATAQEKKGLNFNFFNNKVGRTVLTISFIILTLGLPLTYFLVKNFSTPVSSWYDNSWEYRKPISITNSGVVQTDYDVLVQIDTAALISSSKIQSDCDDIRFVGSDDTTVLTYWIESGCNTTDTNIWVRVPSVTNGSQNIYMYYGNGSAMAGTQTWGGELIAWYQSACPVGWNRVSAADNRLVRGANGYGATGGSASGHTHGFETIVLNYQGSAVSTVSVASGANVPDTTHTHNLGTLTVDPATNFPAYLNWLLCSKTGLTYTTGSISLSESTFVPGWTRVTEMDGKYPMAATAYGGGGGGAHTHTITSGTSGTAGNSLIVPTSALATGGTVTSSGGFTRHTFTTSGSLAVSNNVNIPMDYLIVAGGGGGGGSRVWVSNQGVYNFYAGGGGGAGGVIDGSGNISTGSYGITVGTGGAGGTASVRSASGLNSIFNGLTAIGGGAGYGGGNQIAPYSALAGGSGGAGGVHAAESTCYSVNGATGTSGQGSAGANGNAIGCVSGAGGSRSLTSSISGSSLIYGVGGSGAAITLNTDPPTPSNGTDGRGNGGGGGGIRTNTATTRSGGSGGDGVVIVRYPTSSITINNSSHTHPVSSTNSSSANVRVPYLAMVYQSKDAAGNAPVNTISMFNSLPPLGWTRYTGLDGKYAQGASTIGASGTGSDHGHPGAGLVLTFGAASANTTTAIAPASGSSTLATFPASTHTHTGTAELRTAGGATPSYFELYYAEKNNNSEQNISIVINSEESNVPTPPTIAAAQAVSTTSIRWNFTDTSPTELGFKVYDMSGELKATCEGANLSYCDETGLSPNTQYTRQIKAYNANGDSLTYSSSTSRYTLVSAPTLSFGTLTADGGSGASIELTSSSVVNVEQGSSGIYFDCTDASCDEGINSWIQTLSDSANGLGENVQYSFAVKARNGDGVETAYSSSGSRYTLLKAPVLTVSAESDSTLGLLADGISHATMGNGQSATYFECLTQDCPYVSSWVSGLGYEADATGLLPNTQYTFRVKVRNGDGVETAYSSNAQGYTLAATPLPISFSNVTSDSFRVTLNPNFNGNPSSTRFGIYDNGTGDYINPVDKTFTASPIFGTYDDFEGSTGFIVSGLNNGTTYELCILAVNEDDAESSEACANTTTELVTPNILSATVISADTIRWRFEDNGTNEDGFNLYDGDNNLIKSCVGANLTFCEETGLSPNTQYTRKVSAYNTDLESGKSNTTSAYTYTVAADAPTVSFGVNTATVTVNPGLNPANTSFAIRETVSGLYVQDDGSLDVTKVQKTVAQWGSKEVTGLLANTSYTFVVLAENVSAENETTSPATTGYTLTDTLQSPLVGSVASTTITFVIRPGSHSSTTQYAAYSEEDEGYIDRTNGQIQEQPSWGTYAQWGGASGFTVTGREINSLYQFRIKARNGDNVEGALSDIGSAYTYSNIPSEPTVEAVSSTVLKVTVNQNGNPSTVEYAVQFSTGAWANFATGLSQVSAVWGSYEDWGGVDGIGLSGFSPNASHSFRVASRNSSQIIAGYSGYEGATTLANTPGAPEVTRINSTSVTLEIDRNGNPQGLVTYAIQEAVSGDFVNTSGNFVQSAVWGSYADYGGTSGFTISGLTPGQTYDFRVKARNSDLVETGYSPSAGEYTSLGAPTIASATVLDSITIQWNFTESESTETGFRVFTEDGTQVAQCNSANITSCTEYGLTPNTTYTRKVAAYDASGNGDFSQTATATTFAAVPASPTVATVSSTSLNVKLETNGNGGSTEFALQETISGNYVNPSNGNLEVSPTWGTYSTFGSADGVNVVGLFANARYGFVSKARNSENVETVVSDSQQRFTYAANMSVPVVEPVSDVSVRVKVNNGGNNPSTQFRIRESGGKYVAKSGGALTSTEVWGTYTEFGGANGVVVSGLIANTAYEFEVSVRNGDNVVSFTTEKVSVVTLATRPVSVIVSTLSTRGLNIRLNDRYATSLERFAIWNNELSRFVTPQGQLVTEPTWATYNQWGGSNGITVLGLVPGKAYTFQAKTRNSLDIETSFSNEVVQYTNALAPATPVSNVVSTTGARIFITDPGNDPSVQYLIQETTSTRFVSKDDGTLRTAQSWGTYSEFGGDNGLLVRGLPSASDFEFRVRARNGNQVATDYSATITVKTNAVVYNAPAGVEVVLKGQEEVNVTQFEGAQRGEKELSILKEDLLVAQLPVDFNSDKDWSSVVADTSLEDNKAVVKVGQQNGLDGVFTLYVPAGDTVNFRLCPDSSTLDEVTSDCEGGVLFEGPFPQTKEVEGADVVVSKAVLDGTAYWIADGLSGTGGLGEQESEQTENPGSEPTEEPSENPVEEPETPPLVINLPNIEEIVQNFSNTSVQNAARAVLTETPRRTVLAMKQVSTVVDSTPIGNLKEPELVVVATAATAATVTVGLAVVAGGFVNIPYLIAQFVIGLLSFIGFVKKVRPYGLVYDAVTKKPINRAVVRIYNMSDRLVWTDVTSTFGTFGANLPIGKYKILVVKPGYKYPSEIVPGHVDYPLEPVYHGEQINFNRRNEFNIVIPMDPKERTPFAALIAKTLSSASVVVKLFHVLLFVAGLVLGIHTMYKYPSRYNLIALLFYVPAFILLVKNLFVRQRSKGMVIDKNGKPIEGVTVTLKEMKFDKYVAKRVTDSNGEYQMVVPNGTYQLGIMDERFKAVRYEGGSSLVSRKKNAKELVIDRAIIVKRK